MKPVAEIFSQGEEIISGQIIDSNAAWLSQQLSELGFNVTRHTSVGDHLDALSALIGEIAARADLCICTGGLGPTVDDLTAQAVSIAISRPLLLDEQALVQIRQYFAFRQQPMPEANRKQAYLPETALRIDNAFGTAPGFALQFRRCRFVFLPGVPLEMEGMFNSQVRPQLLQGFSLQPDCLVTLRSVGIGESSIQQNLASLVLLPEVQLGFRVTTDDVQTKLLFPAGFPAKEKQLCVQQAAALIGDYVYAIDGLHGPPGDFLTVINDLMQEKGYSLSVLETASHGQIAAKCIGMPWLHCVDVCLDSAQIANISTVHDDGNDFKCYVPHVAERLTKRRQTDLALVQLYSGDHAAYCDIKKSIVLYNALYTPEGVIVSSQPVAGTIKQKQNRAALLALDLLRRYLQNKVSARQ